MAHAMEIGYANRQHEWVVALMGAVTYASSQLRRRFEASMLPQTCDVESCVANHAKAIVSKIAIATCHQQESALFCF